MYEVFDLVICFVGSAACSPTLEAMLERHPTWDPRFFFSKWNQPLIDKLLLQQEKLKKAGVTRHILILMDDVILTGKADDSLAHMCMRGRHFNISVMMAAVSYTSISKRSRRSLDFLLVFSCPMQGDRKILSWEYARNSGTADWVMNNLDENQCLVFETSRKVQRLYVWKSQLLMPEDFIRTRALPDLLRSGRRRPYHHPVSRGASRRIGSNVPENCTQSSARTAWGEPGETGESPPHPPGGRAEGGYGSASGDPGEAEAYSG